MKKRVLAAMLLVCLLLASCADITATIPLTQAIHKHFIGEKGSPPAHNTTSSAYRALMAGGGHGGFGGVHFKLR